MKKKISDNNQSEGSEPKREISAAEKLPKSRFKEFWNFISKALTGTFLQQYHVLFALVLFVLK